MKMQISELARLFNVSVRTLQYYDSVGLLKPTEVTEKGYRLYDDNSVSEMKKNLRYKQLGFSLDSISKLISDEKGVERRGGLLAQKRKLTQEIKRLNSTLEDIDRELAKPVKLSNWFDKILKDYNYSSCNYSTLHGEDFITWGKADYENDLDFTTSSRFPLGTLTSQFTAYCIIRFQELGLLRTDDPIGKYFPEIICGGKVTIQHLLDVSSGLSDEYFEQKASEGWNDYCEKIGYNELPYELQGCYFHEYNKGYCKLQSVSEIIEAANFAPLKFVSGEKYDFANINYLILRIILEKLSAKPLEEILDEYIFTPLEMDNTTLYGSTDVVGYVDNLRIEYYDDIYGGATDGISTIDDLIKWYKFLINKNFFEQYMTDGAEYSCGWFNNENNYALQNKYCEVTVEVNVEKDGNLYISVMNKQPVPDGHTRAMYYPIECDDGYFKLEIWDMPQNSEIKVNSIKIFDEDARELYSEKLPKSGYFISLRNDGKERHAEEFAEDSTYYYEMNLSEIFKNEFKPLKKYIIEAKAECTEYSFDISAKLGMVYKRKGEWISDQYFVFYNQINAYDLFMEALTRVTRFQNGKFYEFIDNPQNEE